jgi:redox-sensing transcriptional repressor
MPNKKIPESTISRLFVYLRELTELLKVNIPTISSAELGDRLNLSDSQVRKDLGYFGQFGTSGSGYNVQDLKNALEKILGKHKSWNVAVVGVGHLGSALLAYPGFKEHNLAVVAAFDSSSRKVGKKISGITIASTADMPQVIKNKKVSIGIIAVPAKNAQDVAQNLINSGIECVLNFAPTRLNVPENIKVKNVDVSVELETLSYFLANKKDEKYNSIRGRK